MDDKEMLQLMLSKIDSIEQKIIDLQITTEKQELTLKNQSIILAEHVRRSNSIEKKLELHEQETRKNLGQINRRVYWVEGISKFVAALAIIVGLISQGLKWL